jgi:hypothetical protein
MTPESWSSRSARFTVGREAPKILTSWDSLGNRCPGSYSPLAMASVSVWRISACFDSSPFIVTA